MQVVEAVQSYQGQRGGQRARVAVKRGVQETCSTQEGAQLQRAGGGDGSRQRSEERGRRRRRLRRRWRRSFISWSPPTRLCPRYLLLGGAGSARRGWTWRSRCRGRGGLIISLPHIPTHLHLPPSFTPPPTNLKAMTMTRAKMAPCMNRWLMQPGSTAELCGKSNQVQVRYSSPDLTDVCWVSAQTLLPGLTGFFFSGPLPVLLK